VHRKAVEDGVDHILDLNKAIKIKIHNSSRYLIAIFEDEAEDD
jgi:hypothetical protein